jgi:energy-coupling factor transport system permease protein
MHPLVKIISLIALLIITNLMSHYWVGVICTTMVIMAMVYGNGKLLALVFRMRWLWISMMSIYALTTPGEYIAILPSQIKVTYEGVFSGLLQMLRLLTAIASINYFFSNSHKMDLLIGLDALLSPLKWLGLNVERFSARLFLTLDYVDDFAMNSTIKMDFLNKLNEPTQFLEVQYLQIPHVPLTLFDRLIISAICAMCVGVIVFKVL